MTTLKTLLIVALSFLTAVSGLPQTTWTTSDLGITNSLAASATLATTADIGTNVLDTRRHGQVGFVLSFSGSDISSNTITIPIAGSIYGSTNWETRPQLAIVATAQGLSPVVVHTNIDIGARLYLRVATNGIVNACTNSITNVQLRAVLKGYRLDYQ